MAEFGEISQWPFEKPSSGKSKKIPPKLGLPLSYLGDGGLIVFNFLSTPESSLLSISPSKPLAPSRCPWLPPCCPFAALPPPQGAHLDVGVARVAGAPLATAALLLVVGVELGRAQDGHPLALVGQGEGLLTGQSLLVLPADRQNDGHRLVDRPACRPTKEEKNK